jgi:hypothetical protein
MSKGGTTALRVADGAGAGENVRRTAIEEGHGMPCPYGKTRIGHSLTVTVFTSV